MKRIYLWNIIVLFVLLYGCKDEKQIIEKVNDIETNQSDSIHFDTLYVAQTGSFGAVVNLKVIIPDTPEEYIEYGIELSLDSSFSDITSIPTKGAIDENNINYISIEGLRPNYTYYYRTYIKYQNKVITGHIYSFKTLPIECDYVDLGLSVLWATCNIGANKPEEYGSYYAWGEKETKDTYNWSNYKWKKENSSLLNKYCTIEYYGIVDNKVRLEPGDDVAQCLYGKDWHMPYKEDWLELENNCKWEWTSINNTNGWLITSLIEGYKDKSIFLPAAGIKKENNTESIGCVAHYWSICLNEEHPNVAQVLSLDSIEHKTQMYDRCYGLTIRPVSISQNWYDKASISLNYIEKTAFPGSIFNLVATINYEDSIVYHTGVWSSDNPSVAMVNENGCVVALSEGEANIYYSINTINTKCSVYVVASESEIEHNYVDLGLSVNWATFNVGAIVPEGFGDLYAWGEIETKESYTLSNYKYAKGYHDGMTQLALSDDVANVKWGGNWRIPSDSEFRELRNNCDWIRTTLNGVNGYIVTSKITGYTDRSIFLPETKGTVSGSYQSCYWTNTIGDDWNSFQQTARSFTLYYAGHWGGSCTCYTGCSVRPVSSSPSWLSTLSIEIVGDSSILIPQYSSSLKAIIRKGDDIISPGSAIHWSISDSSIAIVHGNGSGVWAQAISPGTAVITASFESISAQYLITVHAESELEHEYVDLGLSVKWATTNLGSLDVSYCGNYFAWGETNVKEDYNEKTYKWYDDSEYYSKYNNNDKKTVLNPDDDAAHVTWGGEWRMPTVEEFNELFENCTLNIVDNYNDHYMVVKSNINGFTDRSITLPLKAIVSYFSTSYVGHYWTCSLLPVVPYVSNYNLESNPNYAIGIYIGKGYTNGYANVLSGRYNGYCIRPVITSSERKGNNIDEY